MITLRQARAEHGIGIRSTWYKMTGGEVTGGAANSTPTYLFFQMGSLGLPRLT